jgi:hypothetical protein
VSNLSDLIPAGASGKTIEAVATANITSKAPVILNSAGTVTPVGTTPQSSSIGALTTYSGTTASRTSTTYVSNNKFCVIYQHGGGSSYPNARIGTITGTSVSWGAATVIVSTTSTTFASCYDPVNDKVVAALDLNTFGSDNGQTYVGTVSGTGISFGTKVQFASGTVYPYSMVYDTASGNCVIAYVGVGSTLDAIVGAVSGTTITFGTAVQSTTGNKMIGCYNSSLNNIAIAYFNPGSSNRGELRVATVTGTAISFGTAVVFSSDGTYPGGIAYDSVQNKVLITYQNRGASDIGTGIVGTPSGTTMTFGATATFDTLGDYGSALFKGQAYSPLGAQHIVGYSDAGDSAKGKYTIATISGTTPTFATPVQFDGAAVNHVTVAIDESGPYALMAFQESGGVGRSIVYKMAADITNLTATNFVGIADAAISSAATGTVVVQGGTATGLSSLTTGSKYYVQDDGTITTVSSSVNAGLAISTTSLLLNGDS